MAWKIDFAKSAEKDLKKLDEQTVKRILRFLYDKVKPDPRAHGEPLKENLAGFWRYRIGNHRVYVEILDEVVSVLVVRIGHRKDVYRR